MNRVLKDYLMYRQLWYRHSMLESEYKEMVAEFLKEKLKEEIDIDVYPQEGTFLLEVSFYEQRGELDDKMEELFGSTYWDNAIITAEILNEQLFESTDIRAMYRPESLELDDPIIEFLVKL